MQTIFFAWTEERVADLTDMWMSGQSASQCAAKFGVTRNAAMGKIKRLNLPPRERVGSGIESRSVLPQPKRKHRRKDSPLQQPSQSVPFRVRSNGKGAVLLENAPDLELVDLPDEDIPVEQRKTLLELTNETCRWPIGDGADLFFCGNTDADLENHRPYCRAHHRIAFNGIPLSRSVSIPPRNVRV